MLGRYLLYLKLTWEVATCAPVADTSDFRAAQPCRSAKVAWEHDMQT
jgi:hypothetical protein